MSETWKAGNPPEIDRRGFWSHVCITSCSTPLTQGPCVKPIYSKDEFPGVKFQRIIAVTLIERCRQQCIQPGNNEAEAALLSFL